MQSSNSKCSIRPGEMKTIQFNKNNSNKKSMLLTTHLEQGDGVRVSIHIITPYRIGLLSQSETQLNSTIIQKMIENRIYQCQIKLHLYLPDLKQFKALRKGRISTLFQDWRNWLLHVSFLFINFILVKKKSVKISSVTPTTDPKAEDKTRIINLVLTDLSKMKKTLHKKKSISKFF